METRITHKRVLHNPHMGFLIGDNYGVKKQTNLMKVLASNLDGLMADHATLRTNKAVEERSGVGASTIQRIRAQEGTTTLEKIEAIAGVFQISAAELLSESGRSRFKPDALTAVADEIIELISLYQQSTIDGRRFILDSARGAEKALAPRWARTGSDD